MAPPQHHQASAKVPTLAVLFQIHPAAEQARRVREYQNRQQCSWQEAWDAVKAEHPHLFDAGRAQPNE
jgi:hypothetical protein